MKLFHHSILFLALCSTSLQAENAVEIAGKFEKEKIAAVTKYLEENPDAKDADQARSILIGANLTIGEYGPIPDLLEKRYESQTKDGGGDLQRLVSEIAVPFVETATISGERDRAKAFLTKFKADFAAHPMASQLNQALDQIGANLYLPGVGDKMDLAFTATNGEEVDMSKMKDKVILVDFWATWCGPCIAEMPNVIAAYENFHDQGFEVVGVSLDESQEALDAFTKERGMDWPQYFDGKGWGNELAQRYGIKGIPATFLVGKDGKIVASNLRGPALEEALVELLGEPSEPEAKTEAKKEEKTETAPEETAPSESE